MKTTQIIPCPLPGLEAVSVEVNMMAAMQAFDDFVSSMGRKAWDDVIVGVEGWPEGMGSPESLDAPMAWRVWLVRTGISQAVTEYAEDPN